MIKSEQHEEISWKDRIIEWYWTPSIFKAQRMPTMLWKDG